MPQDIKKPEALIQEEKTIQAKFKKSLAALDRERTKKNDEVDTHVKTGSYISPSQQFSITSDGDLEKSKIFNDIAHQKASLEQKSADEIKSFWSQHGWSQVKEDAFNRQEAAKGKESHSSAKNISSEPRISDKFVQIVQQKNEVKDAISAYVNDSSFDFTFKSTRLDTLRAADAKTDAINVVVSNNGARIVSVSSNGQTKRHDEKTKPNAMTDADRTPAVKALEDFVKNNTLATLRQNGVLETFATGVVEQHKAVSAPYGDLRQDIKLTAIVLDDQKHVLLATDNGAFEVVNIKPDAATPTQSFIKVQPTPTKGAVKH